MGYLDDALDVLRGASNSAAGTVSAPVDGIAWLLRKAGLDVGQPVGGSDWMAAKGLTVQPRNPNAGLLGESLGGILPIVAAAKWPQIAMGLLTGVKPDASKPVNELMRLLETPRDGKIAGLLSDSNASKFVGREAPKTQQRDFGLDYPNQANLGPVGSRITTDLDGRPLASGPIAGRRTVGGLDETQGHTNALDIGAAFGVPTRAVPGSALPRDTVGAISSPRGKWQPSNAPPADTRIDILKSLDEYGFERTNSHEIGHLLDKVSGNIKTDGLSSELGRLYSELNSRGWASRWQLGAKPQEFGYLGDDVKRELMAEAIHAYRTNPNYIKTIAPKTAAAIRAAVNPNPLINKHIQFNSLAPAAGTGLLGSILMSEDQ
jgi:hypothetical protein